MNLRARLYVVAIVCASMGIALLVPWSTLAAISIAGAFGLVALVVLGVGSEALAIDFTVGGRQASSSISFIVILASALHFPPAATICITALMQILADVFVHRRQLWVIAFNAAQGVLSTASAIAVYTALGGGAIMVSGINVVAFAGMVVTLFGVNAFVFSGLFCLRHNKNIFAVFRSVIGPGAANLVYGVLASPGAVLTAIVYDRLYIGGLILMVLPLLLIRFSYLSKVQLQQANRDLLKVLIKVIETRDPYTSGHSLRVSNLARLIAEDLGLPRRQVEQVETAGLLHDIGKIDAIYASIIQKPSDLTEEELRVIKTHAVKGAEFLKSMTSLSDAVIEGVRHHHERYDGMGYPDRLRGDAIPLYSRIIMICDAIDAMLSDRPYRSALPVEAVERELLRCSGTQFDPEISRVIVRHGTLSRARELVKSEHRDLELIAVGADSR